MHTPPTNVNLASLPHPLPQPPGQKRQGGISDPFWPVVPEKGQSLTTEELQHYNVFYAGRVDPQKFFSLLQADFVSLDREGLKQALQLLTKKVIGYVKEKPSHSHVLPLSSKDVPNTYRVTVTLAFGSTLFVDRTGFDRFGIRSARPRFLKPMPSFPGDAENISPQTTGSDIAVMICSDHPYVNTAIARDIAEKFNRDFCKEFEKPAGTRVMNVKCIEQGFGRPDRREFLRFDDGIDNIRGQEIDKLIYVSPKDPEPLWCNNGSYMVYRKVREMLPVWEALAVPEQEGMIGRKKDTGEPLSKKKTGPGNLTPVYPDHKSAMDGPLNAHIRKVQPRREGTDLFGVEDLDRRFLRRPYPFFEGLDEKGKLITGLHFVAFMKSIQQQFEHVTNMWQMNPEFPVPGTGIDALYAKGVLQTMDGGYYFCPPAPAEGDYFGSGMFSES